MEVNIPEPNEALTALLMSQEMKAIVEERGHMAQMLYQADVAKRTGRLAASAQVQTEIGGVRHDRWVSHLTVGGEGAKGMADYGAAHQFGHWEDESRLFGNDFTSGESAVFVEGSHELNRVLEQLGGI